MKLPWISRRKYDAINHSNTCLKEHIKLFEYKVEQQQQVIDNLEKTIRSKEFTIRNLIAELHEEEKKTDPYIKKLTELMISRDSRIRFLHINAAIDVVYSLRIR